jgi:chaperonin GroES
LVISDLFCILVNNKGKQVMKYQPLNDYVLVKTIKEEEKTKGGLYKPSDSKEQMHGEVISVGNGIYTSNGTLIPMVLNVGDRVIVPNTGIQMKLDGEKYNMYREQEILMVINE